MDIITIALGYYPHSLDLCLEGASMESRLGDWPRWPIFCYPLSPSKLLPGQDAKLRVNSFLAYLSRFLCNNHLPIR
jgi:hypothetical protein